MGECKSYIPIDSNHGNGGRYSCLQYILKMREQLFKLQEMIE